MDEGESKMERPFHNDIEKLMIDFVRHFGGKTVPEYLGIDPSFPNADFFFPDQNVIVELKCLEKDLFSEEDTDRNEKLIDKWLVEGLMRKADIIPILMGRKIIPQDCMNDIQKLTRKTFQHVLQKANKQLRETKKEIGNSETQKVLLVCNDGNYFLEPAEIFGLLVNILACNKDLDIDCLVFFTINQVAMFHPGDLDRPYWLPTYKAIEDAPMLGEFINELGRKFFEYEAKVSGVSIDELREYENMEEGYEMIRNLKNIPKEVVYKK